MNEEGKAHKDYSIPERTSKDGFGLHYGSFSRHRLQKTDDGEQAQENRSAEGYEPAARGTEFAETKVKSRDGNDERDKEPEETRSLVSVHKNIPRYPSALLGG